MLMGLIISLGVTGLVTESILSLLIAVMGFYGDLNLGILVA